MSLYVVLRITLIYMTLLASTMQGKWYTLFKLCCYLVCKNMYW